MLFCVRINTRQFGHYYKQWGASDDFQQRNNMTSLCLRNVKLVAMQIHVFSMFSFSHICQGLGGEF